MPLSRPVNQFESETVFSGLMELHSTDCSFRQLKEGENIFPGSRNSKMMLNTRMSVNYFENHNMPDVYSTA